MMHNLTQRQIEILKSVIEEYIDTAEPVGSETIEKKHNLSASPATIRNEMVHLSKLGYLQKPHSSAGRIPTSGGMKFYVKELMKEKELSTVEEVAFKEGVWDYRDQTKKFLKEITKVLADKTKTLAIVTTSEGEIICSGYANILDMPEFYDIDITKSLLTALDEYEYFMNLFHQPREEGDVHVIVGEDFTAPLQGPYGIVFTDYHTGSSDGQIGVIGPVRLNYTSIIPTLRYVSRLIQDTAKGW